MGNHRGQATLSLVFLVGGIILVIAVTLAVLIISFLNSGYGFQAANRALAGAQGGVQDALLQLARNKSFAGTYSFPNGSATVNVTVTQGTPLAGEATIVADSSNAGFTRKIQAVASVSPLGEVNLLTWTQLAL